MKCEHCGLDRKEVASILSQLKRVTILLFKSISTRERITHDHFTFLEVTWEQIHQFNMKVTGQPSCRETDGWPDTNYEVWEARK